MALGAVRKPLDSRQRTSHSHQRESQGRAGQRGGPAPRGWVACIIIISSVAGSLAQRGHRLCTPFCDCSGPRDPASPVLLPPRKPHSSRHPVGRGPGLHSPGDHCPYAPQPLPQQALLPPSHNSPQVPRHGHHPVQAIVLSCLGNGNDCSFCPVPVWPHVTHEPGWGGLNMVCPQTQAGV